MMNRFQAYYTEHPKMVSSPFGGVDGIQRDLLLDVLRRLDLSLDGRRILDVGCGRGYAGDVVAEAGGDYTGVDLVASRKGFRLGIAAADALPFPDATFDGVFCIDAFEHVPDSARAAREFRRVLRPGGFLFLSAPNYGNMAGVVKLACERWGRYEKDTWAPFQRWTPQELEHCLTARKVMRTFREAGFGRIRKIGYAYEVPTGLFPWIELDVIPERIRCRLHALLYRAGRPLVRVWPGASLHLFWGMEV